MSSEIGQMITKFKSKKELNSFLKSTFTETERKRLVKMIKFVELTRLGRNFNDSARGIPSDPKTVRGWVQKAEAAIEYCDANDLDYVEHQDYMYIDFKLCFEEAEQEFKYHLQDIVYDHSKDEWLTDENGQKIQLLKKGDWKAAEKLLKSRFPDEYGDRVDVKNTHEAGEGMQTGALVFPTISTQEMNLSDLSDITKASQKFLMNKVENEDND